MAPNPLPPVDLKIPSSSTTVSVRIIDTTAYISNLGFEVFATPIPPNFPPADNTPCFSFLIEHPSNRKLLFDLGVRKDWENFSPVLTSRIKENKWEIKVEKGVREQLEEHGVSGESIEGIIWSHWHWDHTGDPSTFPPSTALIVGPGFKEAFTPGYPTNPHNPIKESDYAGRELREISFDSASKIGNFLAFDYFGDGSFYLLNTPGHAIGHMCALARVKQSSEGDHFIFMGGDVAHHGAEFRPSKYLPLPETISPDPFHGPQAELHGKAEAPGCPGALFEHLLRDGDSTKPFFTLIDGGAHHDGEEGRRSIEKVIEADGNARVFVVVAHDKSLMDLLDFFPKEANAFLEKGWVEDGRWLFLKDFKNSVMGL